MKWITVLLLSLFMLSACATQQQERSATRGAAAGAVAGAVIGAPNDRVVEGVVIGGVIGAAAGAILAQPGYSAPVQQHEYEEDEHRHHDD